MVSSLDWLTARPVAHRGLHDAQKGIIENTPSAFEAAITGGYGIECDLQISSDGEAMVHHDEALGRLTEGSGRLDAITAAELKRIPFKATADHMITLAELCALVASRTTLVIELKSRFDGDWRLVTRAAEVLAGYRGPAALMSFDPAPIAMLCNIAPKLVRGIVTQRRYRDPEWDWLPAGTRRAMARLGHVMQTRPQFIAYSVRDLPAAIPTVVRRVFGLPLLTWTVRSADDREKAARYADQMIFEGFRP
jgi:glycerophosphoryl diester phosphodiesterase